MYHVLDAMVRMITPILAFTSQEIWTFMPHHKGTNARYALFNDMPGVVPEWELSEDEVKWWGDVLAVREQVNLALECARTDKLIGKPLEAAVAITCPEDVYQTLKAAGEQLKGLFIVSGVALEKGNELSVSVSRAPGEKCPRCWMYVQDGKEGTGLCARCARVAGQCEGE